MAVLRDLRDLLQPGISPFHILLPSLLRLGVDAAKPKFTAGSAEYIVPWDGSCWKIILILTFPTGFSAALSERAENKQPV